MQSQFIKLNEAARILGVSRWTLRRWCREGYNGCPPAIKAGSGASNVCLINRVEWDAFLIKLNRQADVQQVAS